MPYKHLDSDEAKQKARLTRLRHYYTHKAQYYENNKRTRKRCKEVIQSLKNVPCADCKIAYPPYVMDFDHLQDKEFVISTAVNNGSTRKILEEAQKCEVVCSNCHRIRTYNRRVNSLNKTTSSNLVKSRFKS